MGHRQRIIGIFRHSLDLPAEVVVETLAYRAVSQWNSVAHMQLVAALESAFDILMETDDIIDMSDFDTALTILARHGVDTSA
ncbi:MAG: acyl carrier protein [Magnetospiraceae bacterium]